jgi:hypothetical protein
MENNKTTAISNRPISLRHPVDFEVGGAKLDVVGEADFPEIRCASYRQYVQIVSNHVNDEFEKVKFHNCKNLSTHPPRFVIT